MQLPRSRSTSRSSRHLPVLSSSLPSTAHHRLKLDLGLFSLSLPLPRSSSSTVPSTEHWMASPSSEAIALAGGNEAAEGRSLSDENEDSQEGIAQEGSARQPSFQSSSPQRLPDDVVAWLVGFCSTQTLASLSLVSWRTLELASRVLYARLIFRRHGSFDSVFCHRVSLIVRLCSLSRVSDDTEGPSKRVEVRTRG